MSKGGVFGKSAVVATTPLTLSVSPAAPLGPTLPAAPRIASRKSFSDAVGLATASFHDSNADGPAGPTAPAGPGIGLMPDGSNVAENNDESLDSQISPLSAFVGGTGDGPKTVMECPAGPRMASSGIHLFATSSHAAAPPALNPAGVPVGSGSGRIQTSPGFALLSGTQDNAVPLMFSGGPGSPRSPLLPWITPASSHWCPSQNAP